MKAQLGKVPFSTLCYKSIRKLHLNGAARAVLTPLCRSKETMAADQAEKILRAAYAPKESACVRETPRNWSAPEYDLSVLVPTYNNAAFIEACIRSALGQKTEYSFEIVIVNDGSTDDTAEKLKAFSDLNNVTVIDQPNAGVSAARNAAMDRAKGKYFMFLDGDDLLLPNAVQALMQEAFASGAAVVEGGYQTIDLSGNPVQTYEHKSGSLDVQTDLYGYPCFKVMERSMWRQIDFPPKMYYEDSIMAQILWEKAAMDHATARGIAMPVGRYRINPNGFSLSAKARSCCIDTVWITRLLMRDRERMGLAYSQYYYEHLLDMAALSMQRTEYMPKDVRRAVFAMYRAFLTPNGKRFATEQARQQKLERAIHENNFALFELLSELG